MKKIFKALTTGFLLCTFSVLTKAQPVLIVNISPPNPVEPAGVPITPEVTFQNDTTIALISIDFYCTIDGLLLGITPWTGIINPGQFITIPLTTWPSTLGIHQICVNTGFVNSDTLCNDFSVSNVITPPYADNLDTGNVGWFPYNYNAQGWQLTTPNFGTINAPHSSPNSWVVGADSGLASNISSLLFSPIFDFTNVVNPKLSFWQNRDMMPNVDGMGIEFKIGNGAWTYLFPTGNFLNWYNNPNNLALMAPAWDSSSGGWVQSSYNLSVLSGTPQVQFRFKFSSGSSGYDGIAIDDVSIDTCNLIVSAFVNNNVSCFGGNDGSVCIGVLGGTPPYSYLWSNGATVQCLSNLSAGNYSIIVSDSNNCMVGVSVTVIEPPPLTITTPSNVTICQGTDLCITSTGGTPPYSYLWSNGSTTACLVTPSPGAYSITITDANACSVMGSFNLNYFPSMSLNLPPTIVDCDNLNPTCINVTGGTQPFVYMWSDSQTDSCHYFLNAGIYTITVTDVNGCTGTASTIVDGGTPVFVSLTLVAPSSCGMCDGIINLSYGGGIGPYTQTWIPFPPPNLNALCENDFFEVNNFDQHGCVGSLSFGMPYACPPVWPGDANYDGTANNLDLLPIGIGYGTTGPVRPNASLTWIAQPAIDWTDTLIAGTNYKHIDCNGDGTINDADTLAIIQNYGQTHPLRLLSPSQNLLDPYLYFDIVVDTVGTSQQLDVPLMFGTSLVPADSIYGLAFTVNYDTALVKADSVGISFSPSWIGTIGTDMITIQHNDSLNGKLYVGMTRIDHNNVSGFGQIAKVSVVTVDNVSGKIAATSIFDTLTFILSDVSIIDKDENVRNVNLGNDTLIVEDSTTSIYEILTPEKIKVYPNPAKDKLFVKFPNQLLVNEISVSNVIGKKMESESVLKNNSVEIRNLKQYSNGIYFLKIKTDKGTVVKKFSVMN